MKGASVWLAEADRNYAEPIRSALADKGAVVSDYSSLAEMTQALNSKKRPHLLIMDADRALGENVDLLTDMRSRTIGGNPFVAAVLTSWDSSESNLRRLSLAGADYVIGKPFSNQTLLEKVTGLVNAKRRFIACEDYIGPAIKGIGPQSLRPRPVLVPDDFAALANRQNVRADAIDVTWTQLMTDRARVGTGFVADGFLGVNDDMEDAELRDHATKLAKECQLRVKELRETPLDNSRYTVEAGGVFANAVVREGWQRGGSDARMAQMISSAIIRAGENREDDLPYARRINQYVRNWLT